MLSPYFVIALIFGYQVQGSVIQSEDRVKTAMERLSTAIKGKCLKNGVGIKDALGEFTDFILCRESLISKNLDDSVTQLKDHCLEHVPEVVTCLTKFVQKLEPCLDSEEKYLPKFMLDGYETYAKYACENLNVIITDVLTTNTGKCIMQFFQQPNTDPHKVCYAKSKIFGDDASIHTITKSELCNDLFNIRSCYENVFDKHCPDAPEIKKFEVEIMTAGLIPCANVMEEADSNRSNDIREMDD